MDRKCFHFQVKENIYIVPLKIQSLSKESVNRITSLAKEVMFLVTLVCLSVFGQHYSKCYDRIGQKFYGGVLGSTMKN